MLYFTQPAVPRRNGWYHGTTSNRGRYTHYDRRRSCFPNSPSLLGFSLLASRWVTQFEKLSRDGAIEQNLAERTQAIRVWQNDPRPSEFGRTSPLRSEGSRLGQGVS